MNQPKRAGDQPIEVELQEGRNYAWCACGLSENQPFCDGSHQKTDLQPVVFKAQKSETRWMCACKGTRHKPFCDGSHKS